MNHCGSFAIERYPKLSLGKTVFELLKSRDAQDAINVDAATGEILTSSTLLQQSVKAATFFKTLGVQKGDVVSIICENCIDYVVPTLAALYLGTVVNPLNPGYLKGEMRHCLLLSKPKLVLVSKQALDVVLNVKRDMACIEKVFLMGQETLNYVGNFDDLLKSIVVDVGDFHPVDLDPLEDAAFIVLSSGTTGLPKGVLLTHENFRIPLQTLSYSFCETQEDKGLITVPFFHLYGQLLQMLGLIFCVKMVILRKFKPDLFLKTIQDHRIARLYLVPVLVQFLAKTPLVEDYDVSCLRTIIVGAAPLGKDSQYAASKRLGVGIHQVYGLSETCGPCVLQIDKEKGGSAGVPVFGARVKVCDPQGKTLQPLETGEICLKGSCTMKGYLPHQDHLDHEGFFHSGDLGYLDRDGYLYIVDRIKDMIKYKGFQVSPVELETLILTHPEVQDCGVIGIADERAGEVPLAFVVPKPGSRVKEDDIVDFVAGRISVQKRLYGGARFVKEIPRTGSGKILRRFLVKYVRTGA